MFGAVADYGEIPAGQVARDGKVEGSVDQSAPLVLDLHVHAAAVQVAARGVALNGLRVGVLRSRDVAAVAHVRGESHLVLPGTVARYIVDAVAVHQRAVPRHRGKQVRRGRRGARRHQRRCQCHPEQKLPNSKSLHGDPP